MLFATEITNPAKRAAAWDDVEFHERSAAIFAAQFPQKTLVKIGAVSALGCQSAFELRVITDESLVSLVVPVGPCMPEADVWSTWVLVLEAAGLHVCSDAAYQAYCFAAVEQEELELECL